MSLMGGSIQREKRYIQKIPAIVWGRESKDAYIYVHGKMSRKEEAEEFAKIAETKGYQTISFDLPEHGEREVGTYCFDIWNGKNDLSQIAEYAFGRWENLSLYEVSVVLIPVSDSGYGLFDWTNLRVVPSIRRAAKTAESHPDANT